MRTWRKTINNLSISNLRFWKNSVVHIPDEKGVSSAQRDLKKKSVKKKAFLVKPVAQLKSVEENYDCKIFTDIN